MVEHQPSKLRVAGSSLVSRSNSVLSRQVAPACAVGHYRPRNSVVEYLLGKEEAIGSSPIAGSKFQSVIYHGAAESTNFLSKET